MVVLPWSHDIETTCSFSFHASVKGLHCRRRVVRVFRFRVSRLSTLRQPCEAVYEPYHSTAASRAFLAPASCTDAIPLHIVSARAHSTQSAPQAAVRRQTGTLNVNRFLLSPSDTSSTCGLVVSVNSAWLVFEVVSESV